MENQKRDVKTTCSDFEFVGALKLSFELWIQIASFLLQQSKDLFPGFAGALLLPEELLPTLLQVRLVCRSLKQRMDEVMSSSFFQSYSLRRFKARAEILALKKISVMERMELLQKELSERHLKFDEDDPLLLRFKTGDWQSSSPLTLEHVISVRFMIEFLQNNGLQGTMLEFCCAQVMASMRRYLQKNLHATWMDAWHDVGVRSIGRLWWPRTTTSSMSATATSSSESSSNAGDRKQATASAAAPATTAAHGEEVWAQDYEFEEESWDGSDD